MNNYKPIFIFIFILILWSISSRSSAFFQCQRNRYTVDFHNNINHQVETAQLLCQEKSSRFQVTWQTLHQQVVMTYLPNLQKINVSGLAVAPGQPHERKYGGETYTGTRFFTVFDSPTSAKSIDVFFGQYIDKCLFSLKARKEIRHQIKLDVDGQAEFPCRGYQRPKEIDIFKTVALAEIK